MDVHAVILIQDIIGSFIGKLVIELNRKHPFLPTFRSFSMIHSFVMSVELEDISQMDNGTFSVSQTVRSEWRTIKENLIHIWTTTLELIAN